MGRLSEAWIAPPCLRQLRELVRYRPKLVALRSGLRPGSTRCWPRKASPCPCRTCSAPRGWRYCGKSGWARAIACVDSLLELIDAFDGEVTCVTSAIAARLRHHPGYTAIQQIPGVGATFAALFVVEIGDVARFARPAQLCSWAGLTPKHHKSDTTVVRGHVTKQGSRLVRWAAVEAVQKLPYGWKLRADRDRIAARRGRAVGKVAAARRLLTLVYYGLRDGHVRCLQQAAA